MALVQNEVSTTGIPAFTTIQQQPSNDALKHAKTYKNLGFGQLALGSLSMLLGIVNIIVSLSYLTKDSAPFVGAGIWCGSMVLVAGILGYRSGMHPNRCLVIAAMVIAILAALLSALMFVFELSGSIHCLSSLHYCSSESRCILQASQFGIHTTLCVIAAIQLIVAIVHSSYCCAGYCCKSSATQLHIPGQLLQAHDGIQQPYDMQQQCVIQGYPNQAFAPCQPTDFYPTSEPSQLHGSLLIPQPPPYAEKGDV